MKLIDRAVSRELTVNVLFAIFVLSLVLVVGNILRKLLPLLVNHDVPVEYLITFIAYILPFSLIFTIPWGLLTAILLVFGRLSADNELIALRANGVSLGRICIPLAASCARLFGCAICLWCERVGGPGCTGENCAAPSTTWRHETRWRCSIPTRSLISFQAERFTSAKRKGNKLEKHHCFRDEQQ